MCQYTETLEPSVAITSKRGETAINTQWYHFKRQLLKWIYVAKYIEDLTTNFPSPGSLSDRRNNTKMLSLMRKNHKLSQSYEETKKSLCSKSKTKPQSLQITRVGKPKSISLSWKSFISIIAKNISQSNMKDIY